MSQQPLEVVSDTARTAENPPLKLRHCMIPPSKLHVHKVAESWNTKEDMGSPSDAFSTSEREPVTSARGKRPGVPTA